MYKIYRKSWYPMLSSIVQNAVKNVLLLFNLYQTVKGGLISAAIFTFELILKKIWKITMLIFWKYPVRLTQFPRARILFITGNVYFMTKLRRKRVKPFLFISIEKFGGNCILSDYSQDYTQPSKKLWFCHVTHNEQTPKIIAD